MCDSRRELSSHASRSHAAAPSELRDPGCGMRRVAGAVCVVAGLGLVSGCSPADQPFVAVWMGEDRKPVAEVHPCGGDDASHVRLDSWDEHQDDAGSPEGERSAVAPSSRAEGGVEDSGWVTWVSVRGSESCPLFSPPASWHAKTDGEQALLPGRTYALRFAGPVRAGAPTTVRRVHRRRPDLYEAWSGLGRRPGHGAGRLRQALAEIAERARAAGVPARGAAVPSRPAGARPAQPACGLQRTQFFSGSVSSSIPTGSGRVTVLPKGTVATISYRSPSGCEWTLTSPVVLSTNRYTGMPVSA